MAALASERTRAEALKAAEADEKTARHVQAGDGRKRAEPQWAQCMEDPGRQLTQAEAQRLGDEKLRRMVDGLPPCERWYADLPDGWGGPPSIPWGSIVRAALGIDDVTGCFIEGRASSCAWVAAGFVPFGLGKVVSGAKVIRAADKIEDAAKVSRVSPVPWPKVTKPSSQVGSKWGKHASDYDLNPGGDEGREWYINRIGEVFGEPDEVRIGSWYENTHGASDYYFFRKGDDLLITKNDGTFVLLFPMSGPNAKFQGAEVIR